MSKGVKGPEVTNQRAELMACIIAIEKTIKMMKNSDELWELIIYSDSKYSINCATCWAKKWILYGWKRKINNKFKEICNLDLIKKLYKLTCLYPVSFIHVRGHQKEPKKHNSEQWELWYGNDQADSFATGAKDKMKAKDNIKKK